MAATIFINLAGTAVITALWSLVVEIADWALGLAFDPVRVGVLLSVGMPLLFVTAVFSAALLRFTIDELRK